MTEDQRRSAWYWIIGIVIIVAFIVAPIVGLLRLRAETRVPPAQKCALIDPATDCYAFWRPDGSLDMMCSNWSRPGNWSKPKDLIRVSSK